MADAATMSILIKAHDEASGVLKSVGSEAGGLGSKLGLLAGAAIAAGGAFVSLQAIEGAVSSTQDLGEAVLKFQRITGTTAEDASHMLFAFKEMGIESDTAATMLGRFSKNMFAIQIANEDGSAPSKTTAQVLKDIGVNALDANGQLRPTGDLLGDLADKFSVMPDSGAKTAMAMDLFGKSGMAMLPFLNQGSAGIQELATEADKLGLTLSGDNVAKIHEFTLAHRKMDEAIAGVKLQIGLALMPVLTKFADWFTEHQPQIREFVKEGIEKIQAAIEALKPVAQALWENFQTGIETIGPPIKDFVQFIMDNKPLLIAAITAIGVAILVALGPGALAVAAIIGLIALIGLVKDHWDEIKAKTLEVWNSISDFLNEKFGFLKGLFDTAWGLIKTVVMNRLDEIKVYFVTWFKIFTDIFDFVSAVFHGHWGEAWDAIKQLVSDALGGIKTILGDELAIFGALMSAAWDGIKEVARLAWNGLKDIISTVLGDVIQFMKDLPGNLLSAVGDLGSLLFDAGKALIQGLWDGIENLVPALLDLARSIAGDIAGAIGSALHIGSPSQVMFEIGQHITEGLRLGMSEGGRPLTAILPQMMAGAMPTAAPGGAAQTQQMAAGSTVHIHGDIILPSVREPADFARGLYQALRLRGVTP